MLTHLFSNALACENRCVTRIALSSPRKTYVDSLLGLRVQLTEAKYFKLTATSCVIQYLGVGVTSCGVKTGCNMKTWKMLGVCGIKVHETYVPKVEPTSMNKNGNLWSLRSLDECIMPKNETACWSGLRNRGVRKTHFYSNIVGALIACEYFHCLPLK